MEAEDEIFANGSDGSSRNRPIISGKQLDVEAYASLYTGRTKITRILFIADHCNNPTMQFEALRMAYDEIKKGDNKQLFREITVDRRALFGSKYYSLHKFLEVAPELGSSYNEVIAPQDVATYGGICALASFERTELKNKVIDNLNFRNFLELVPEVRELIHDFYSTLIQYAHPFVSVDLNMMANARIDSHNKILNARHADQRNATFQRVLQSGSEFDQDVRAMLLRANLIKREYNPRACRKL
ncbi:hypothetical protein P3X46_014715 [Hevea brasiliensis]|uniref:PCI domain-containing protein n=1 Tax=Hevea brasiliensis TaxID=3981 RepID=A0ABQ9LUY3_HEVBR|nr:hypothetical protein P3X46_014715 [Hevea brasiliensis]